MLLTALTTEGAVQPNSSNQECATWDYVYLRRKYYLRESTHETIGLVVREHYVNDETLSFEHMFTAENVLFSTNDDAVNIDHRLYPHPSSSIEAIPAISRHCPSSFVNVLLQSTEVDRPLQSKVTKPKQQIDYQRHSAFCSNFGSVYLFPVATMKTTFSDVTSRHTLKTSNYNDHSSSTHRNIAPKLNFDNLGFPSVPNRTIFLSLGNVAVTNKTGGVMLYIRKCADKWKLFTSVMSCSWIPFSCQRQRPTYFFLIRLYIANNWQLANINGSCDTHQPHLFSTSLDISQRLRQDIKPEVERLNEYSSTIAYGCNESNIGISYHPKHFWCQPFQTDHRKSISKDDSFLWANIGTVRLIILLCIVMLMRLRRYVPYRRLRQIVVERCIFAVYLWLS